MLRLTYRFHSVEGGFPSVPMSLSLPNDRLSELTEVDGECTLPSFYEKCVATDGTADTLLKNERVV